MIGNNCEYLYLRVIPHTSEGERAGEEESKKAGFLSRWDLSPLMSETNGHFEGGRWVLNPAPEPEPEPAPAAPHVKEHMHEASQSVRRAVNDVMNAGHHLFGTPEGHEYIEQAARKAGEDLEQAVSAWAESARQALRRR